LKNYAIDLLNHPILYTYLKTLWGSYKKVLLLNFILELTYMILFTISIYLRGTDARRSQHTIELYIVIVSFLWVVVQAKKIQRTFQQHSALSGQVMLVYVGVCHCALIWCSLGLRLGNQYVAEEITSATAIILGWIHVLYYHAALKLTGPFVVMVYKMIFSDIVRFGSIFILLILGFGSAFYLLFDDPRSSEIDDFTFNTLGRSFQTVFLLTFGQVGYDQFDGLGEINYARKIFALIYFYVYIVLSAILMLNLLIAMMGATFGAVQEHAELEWRWQWTSILFLLERNMTQSIRDKLRPKNQINKNGIWYMVIEEENPKWKLTDATNIEVLAKNTTGPLLSPPNTTLSALNSQAIQLQKEEVVFNEIDQKGITQSNRVTVQSSNTTHPRTKSFAVDYIAKDDK